MTTMALLNEYVEINGVDMSDHCRQGTLAVEAAALDSSAFGDGWQENTGGQKSGTLSVEFLDDFDAAQVDATLWPIFGTVVTFTVRPSADPVSATNPQYSGKVLIQQHTVGGSLGEMATKSLTFPTSGAVARATA